MTWRSAKLSLISEAALRPNVLYLIAIILVFASNPVFAQKTPLFRDFPSGAIYSGPHAQPNLSNPQAYNFRTRLRDAAREDVNFASHYRVVIWGCGTGCVFGGIVDVVSGHVVLFPFSICCSAKIGESDFQPVLVRPNSRLIVFVGMRGEEPPDAAHFYEFTGSQLHYLASSQPFAPAPDASSVPAEVQPSNVSPKGASRPDCWSISDRQTRLDCYDGKLSYASPQPAPTPAPVAAAAPALPASDLSASNLPEMKATYKQNQARFSRDYVGKTFSARMEVRSVVESLFSKGSFRVSFGAGFGGVDCVVSDKTTIDFVTNLNAGDSIFISGTVSDIVFGDVQLSPCKLSAAR
jgi:hypothetical protein